MKKKIILSSIIISALCCRSWVFGMENGESKHHELHRSAVFNTKLAEEIWRLGVIGEEFIDGNTERCVFLKMLNDLPAESLQKKRNTYLKYAKETISALIEYGVNENTKRMERKKLEEENNINNLQRMCDKWKKISDLIYGSDGISKFITESIYSSLKDCRLYNTYPSLIGRYATYMYNEKFDTLREVSDDVNKLQNIQNEWKNRKQLKLEIAKLIDNFYQAFHKEYEYNCQIKRTSEQEILDELCEKNSIKKLQDSDIPYVIKWLHDAPAIDRLQYALLYELYGENNIENLQNMKTKWQTLVEKKEKENKLTVDVRKNNQKKRDNNNILTPQLNKEPLSASNKKDDKKKVIGSISKISQNVSDKRDRYNDNVHAYDAFFEDKKNSEEINDILEKAEEKFEPFKNGEKIIGAFSFMALLDAKNCGQYIEYKNIDINAKLQESVGKLFSYISSTDNMPNEFMDKDGKLQKFKSYNKQATQSLLTRIVNILSAALKKESSEAKNTERKWLQQTVAENLLDNSLTGQSCAQGYLNRLFAIVRSISG